MTSPRERAYLTARDILSKSDGFIYDALVHWIERALDAEKRLASVGRRVDVHMQDGRGDAG